MSKKPSLGDNPLAYNLRIQGTFDFIRDIRKSEGLYDEDEAAEPGFIEIKLDKAILDKAIDTARREGISVSALINNLLEQALRSNKSGL